MVTDPTAGEERHFAVYSHRGLWLIRAHSTLRAIERFIVEECADTEVMDDGRVVGADAQPPLIYAHPLEFIEARFKSWPGQYGGWQIREVPDWVWAAGFVAGVVVLDDLERVAARIAQCRPFLEPEHPRSRAAGFVWYVRQGALVTFYRRVGPWRIRVLRRYLVDREREMAGQECVSAWTGNYDDIVRDLVLTGLPRERPPWASPPPA